MPEVNSPQTPPHSAAAHPSPGALLDGLAGLNRLELITRLRADQQQRWQAGQRVPAETYLREVPALGADPELAIDLIFSEFLLRRDVLGEAPALDEYLARFPEHATVLRHQLELDALGQEAARTQGRGDAAPATAAAPAGASDWTLLGPGGGAAPVAPPGVPALPGYEVVGELGRGGMGLVLRGRDLHLGRDLAVKLLHEEYQGQPHLIRRFVNEARICGRLQHPGVVPVHALGTLPDGRPFFTMKLVEGRTLADLLDERPDPAQDLPRLLAVFEQVCQAVAYAHSKGVIHRDLKPHNVMVGAFGEVQVMDWGLAKVLERDAAGAPVEDSGNDPGVADRWLGTQLGHVLGTLPYMPPEQARGEVGRMDERSDVFGLGAILCEVLTGRPPFTARDAGELLARARACDHAAALAALDGCGADAELVRLAKACLAAEPSDRPGDAGAVAGAVTAYLAGVQERLRRAEVERAAAEVKATEERKRRRLGLGLAAALLLLVVVGGGGAWWAQYERQARETEETLRRQQAEADAAARRQEADTAARLAMNEAGLLLNQARADPLGDPGRFREALAAAGKAKELARPGGEASDDVRRQATDLVAVIATEAEAAKRDRRLLAALLEVRGPREGPRYQQGGKGGPVMLAGPSAEEQFAAAFRAWDRTFDVDVLSTAEAVSRLKGRPPAVVTEVIAALDDWAGERRRPGRGAAKWWHVANLAQALDEGPDATRRELRALLARGNLGREAALGVLAVALRPVPVPFDAEPGEDRQRLRRLAERIDAAREPLLGLLILVRALQEAGDAPRGERLLRAAMEARPQEVAVYQALGQLLAEQRRWPEAVECYRAARALRPELGVALAEALVNGGRVGEGLALCEKVRAEPSDNPWLDFVHGNALHRQGRHQEAVEAYRATLRLMPNSHTAHDNLGNALHALGRYEEAEAAHREALRLKPDFPEALNNLGAVLYDRGRYKEADAECRKALRLRPDYLQAYSNLGRALHGQGRHQEAEMAQRQVLRLNPDAPEAYYHIGLALYHQGRFPQAEEAYRKAIRLKPDYHQAHINLGATLYRLGRYPQAEEAYREAIRLRPDQAEAHANLGALRATQGRYKEAEAAYRAAIRLQPDYPGAYYNLGSALIHQGRNKEAEAADREAIRLKADYFQAYTDLGAALDGQGRPKEAEAAYREALRLKPDYPLGHYNLGHLLARLGRYKEAEDAYRAAVRFQPDYAEAYNNLGEVLADPKERESAFRAALRLKPDFLEAHNNLGDALYRQGRYKEAEEAFRAVIRLKPGFPLAHCNLGHALRNQGRFGEALEALRRGHALGNKTPGWPHPSADWVRRCERLMELDGRLPAVLKGDAEPATALERLEFAALCQLPCKRRHAAAAHLAADAFAAEPKLGDDLRQQFRYNAACSAARAAGGQAEDATRLPDKVALMLRRQALGWLRADLALYAQLVGRDDAKLKEAVRQRLAHWQKDPDFAAVRDKAALARLADDEHKDWRHLWDEVGVLVAKMRETK